MLSSYVSSKNLVYACCQSNAAVPMSPVSTTLLHLFAEGSLLESGFVPSSKSSPSSFCRELGELLSAEFNPKSDSAMTSNLAELCLCQVSMKNNWANKTISVEYQFHRVPNRKNSANTDMWATPCSKRLLQREGCSQQRRNVHVLLMAVLKSILVLGKNACSWARPLVFSPL